MAPKTPARSRAAVAVEAAAPAPTPAKSARGKGKKAAKLADEVAEAEAAALVEPDIVRSGPREALVGARQPTDLAPPCSLGAGGQQRDLEQLERSLTASLRTQLRLPRCVDGCCASAHPRCPRLIPPPHSTRLAVFPRRQRGHRNQFAHGGGCRRRRGAAGPAAADGAADGL